MYALFLLAHVPFSTSSSDCLLHLWEIPELILFVAHLFALRPTLEQFRELILRQRPLRMVHIVIADEHIEPTQNHENGHLDDRRLLKD